MWAALNAMDCPAIIGSKGDQMWQKTLQWMVQLFKVAQGPAIILLMLSEVIYT